MPEASVILNPVRVNELKSILGRLLVSLFRNEFYVDISMHSLILYVYDTEKHQARFCAELESSFFEEFITTSNFTVSITNVKNLFNTLSLSSYKVHR